MEVHLRIKGVPSTQHRNILLATDEAGSLWPDVQYKSSAAEDRSHQTIDLRIDEYTPPNVPGIYHEKTNREPIDKLWDILGIFPRRVAEFTEKERHNLRDACAVIRARAIEAAEGDPEGRGTLCNTIHSMVDLIETTLKSHQILPSS